MATRTPRAAAAATRYQQLAPGRNDRVRGYGVMGIPFGGSEYLALRCWPASSFGPGYTAVWHLGESGWTIYATEPPEISCARFIGSAVDRTVTVPIDLRWQDEHRLTVTVGSQLEWTLTLMAGARTRLLNACSSAIPEWALNNAAVLAAMGRVAGPVLAGGRLRLTGTMPNGHRYRIAARQTWLVAESQAHIDSRTLGPPRAAARQTSLGRLWLPQRGFFYADTSAQFIPSTAPERQINHVHA